MTDTRIQELICNILNPNLDTKIIDEQSDVYRTKFKEIYNNHFKENKITYYKSTIDLNSNIINCKFNNNCIDRLIKVDFIDSYNKFYNKQLIDYYESKLNFEKIKKNVL